MKVEDLYDPLRRRAVASGRIGKKICGCLVD